MDDESTKIVDDIVEGFLGFAQVLKVVIVQKHEANADIIRINIDSFHMLSHKDQSAFILLAFFTRGLLKRNEKYVISTTNKVVYRWVNDFYRMINEENKTKDKNGK